MLTPGKTGTLTWSKHGHQTGIIIELKWAQLIPPAATMPPKPQNLFTGAMPPPAEGNDPSPPLEEGAWMSLKQRQPGGGSTPPMVVAELDNKRVRIWRLRRST